jgi:hypothetical protein
VTHKNVVPSAKQISAVARTLFAAPLLVVAPQLIMKGCGHAKAEYFSCGG